MINICMVLLLLGPTLYHISEGCGRVPAKPAPTTIPTSTEAPINGSVRQLRCNQNETTDQGCLNQGTCYVIIIQGDRVKGCICDEEYMGTHCHELNVDVIFPSHDQNIASAGIAASIAVLVVIVIVFTGVAIVYYRRRKRHKRRKKQEQRQRQKDLSRNGNQRNGLLPENHVENNPDLHPTDQPRQHFNGSNGPPPYDGNGTNGNFDFVDEKKPMIEQIQQYKTTSV